MQSINIPLFFCDIFSWLVYGKKQRLLLHGRTRDRQINTKERTKEKHAVREGVDCKIIKTLNYLA
jgi:hypothetical protein